MQRQEVDGRLPHDGRSLTWMLLLAAGFAKPGSKGEKGQFPDEIELHESAGGRLLG